MNTRVLERLRAPEAPIKRSPTRLEIVDLEARFLEGDQNAEGYWQDLSGHFGLSTHPIDLRDTKPSLPGSQMSAGGDDWSQNAPVWSQSVSYQLPGNYPGQPIIGVQQYTCQTHPVGWIEISLRPVKFWKLKGVGPHRWWGCVPSTLSGAFIWPARTGWAGGLNTHTHTHKQFITPGGPNPIGQLLLICKYISWNESYPP
jgi:hypothetical protein